MSRSEKIVESLQKKHGKENVMRLGDKPDQDVEVISTGSLSLDIQLGIGGFPKGRIVEVYGPESSGKTTLCIHAIAEVQKLGLVAGFVDVEHAFDPFYASNLGVDIENLIFSQPGSGESALSIMEDLIKQGVDIVVLDSVAALVPQSEINGEMGDSSVGKTARLMSQAMRKLTGLISKNDTIVIFINQLRSKIGVMFGSPETTTGGNALKFYASVRIDVRRAGASLKDKEGNIIANPIKFKVIKNKLAPPHKVAESTIRFGEGIDLNSEIRELGVAVGIIEKNGAWFKLDGQNVAKGKEAFGQFLNDHPTTKETILNDLREIYELK